MVSISFINTKEIILSNQDLIDKITSYLDLKGRAMVSRVSKLWQQAFIESSEPIYLTHYDVDHILRYLDAVPAHIAKKVAQVTINSNQVSLDDEGFIGPFVDLDFEKYSLKEFIKLKSLKIHQVLFDEKALENLDLRFCKNLKSIEITFANLTNSTLEKFNLSSFRFLQNMDLSENLINSQGLQHLHLDQLKDLRYLNLGYNLIDNEGIKQLNLSAYKNLTSLDVSQSGVTDAFVSFTTTLSKLEKLNLSLNANLAIETFVSIQMGIGDSLRSLDLSGINLSGEKFEQFIDLYWSRLEDLNLSCAFLKHRDLKNFSSKNFPKLYTLNLEDNCIARQGCNYLKDNFSHQLKNLSLKNSFLNDHCLDGLQLNTFENLETLDIRDNPVRNKSSLKEQLATLKNFKLLRV